MTFRKLSDMNKFMVLPSDLRASGKSLGIKWLNGEVDISVNGENRSPSRLNLSSAGGPYGPLEVMFL